MKALAVSILILRLHGGAAASYIDERLTLGPDETANVISHSPFPDAVAPNAIGTFEGKLDAKLIKKFRNEAEKLLPIRNKKYLALNDSIIGELSQQGAEKTDSFTWNFESLDQAKPLESAYAEIKKSLTAHPKAAIKAFCKPTNETLSCSLENVGSENVETVDPLGVTGSLRYVKADGDREVLNPGPVTDPKQMKPKRLTIKPHEKFEFEFRAKSACKDRIVIKTTDLMINSAYEKSLLGELNAQ